MTKIFFLLVDNECRRMLCVQNHLYYDVVVASRLDSWQQPLT